MSDQTIRIDLPEVITAIFDQNGRVFIDMDYMLREYGPVVERQVQGAQYFNDPFGSGVAEGMARMIDQIRTAKETLALEAIYNESE